MPDTPDTRYVQAPDGAWLAYQTFGSGEIDLLLVPGYFSNVDEAWNVPAIRALHGRLGEFARVIVMDRRGTGLSDRMARGQVEPLESHVDHLVAVADAVGAGRVCLFASESASTLALLFAAIHPERVRSAAFFFPWFEFVSGDAAARVELYREMVAGWGTEWARKDLELVAPSVAGDAATVAAWARYLRASGSPSTVETLLRQLENVDVRPALDLVDAPVLLMYRPDAYSASDTRIEIDHALTRLANARLATLTGRDMPYWWGAQDEVIRVVREFFTGSSDTPAPTEDRRLLTVLFTDLVGSTERAAAVGDQRWVELLARHRDLVRAAIAQHRGVEIDTAGDGFFATFDGPARAVRAALSAVAETRNLLELDVRAGVHTGEVQTTPAGPAGLAVHVGARVAAAAAPGEVLVSSTVRDLSAGSGLVYEDTGEHMLKGTPEPWRLFRAAEGTA
jgi:class 3 adenylate cyclase